MKLIKLLLLTIPLMAFQCEPEENCNCEKKLYLWQPPMNSGVVSIPERYDYVRSIFNQCGETTTDYVAEYGEDYNRYKLECE